MLIMAVHNYFTLVQGWATSGPRAGSGPPSILIRPPYFSQSMLVEIEDAKYPPQNNLWSSWPSYCNIYKE